MERNIRTWKQAHTCPTCKTDPKKISENKEDQLASHSVTDCRQMNDGTWVETDPRYGCNDHPVVSMVHLKDGTSLPYSEYAAMVRNSQTES